MAEEKEVDGEVVKDKAQRAQAEALRKRLLRRAVVAGVLIVALIGGLALFESYTKWEELPPQPAPAPTPLAPIAPPAEKPAEAKKTEEPVAEPEKTAPPVTPQKAAEARREGPGPGEPGARPAAPPVAPKKTEEHAPAATVAEQPKPAPAVTGGYVVQLGVFSNVTNAEELRAKLTRQGIPSQLETRVLVGPFKSRPEAEAAQSRLKALGLGGGILVPPRAPK